MPHVPILILFILLLISASLVLADSYDRNDYKHWIDADKDCQDTRQEVLIRDSLIPVTLDEKGCKVLAGRWLGQYTGKFYTDPKDLDIDHLIPLFEAHKSGASTWSDFKREAFANDLDDGRSLIAVYAGVNRSKGAKDISKWLPENPDYICQYLVDWVAVKTRWGLDLDEGERLTISKSNCE